MAQPTRAVEVTAEVYEYLVAHGTPPDATYEAIRADTETLAATAAGMQIGPDQYAFLRVLTEIVGVNLAVEVGTFTGTSAAAVRSEEHTSELQSLMRISYAVFCLQKTNIQLHN